MEHVERRVGLGVGVAVVRDGLDVLEWRVVGENVSWNSREAASDHSPVDDVVDPPECPTRQAKGRIGGVDVVDDKGEAAGRQKVGGGEVGVEGWEGCSGTCVLAQPQSGKGLAAEVEAVVGYIRLWEMTRFPNVGHPSLDDVLP